MELFVAIAMLCQVSAGGERGTVRQQHRITGSYQLECHQAYIHCVNVKNKLPKSEALEKCILEKN
jgi:hypothetical protein